MPRRLPPAPIAFGLWLWLAATLFSSPALAWDFREHYLLGSEAYRAVCLELSAATPGFKSALSTPEQRQRFAMACELLSPKSDQYGQFVALSGDHIDLEQIESLDANIAAKDLVGYLLRASHNADHFHPTAPLEWRKHHSHALDEAVAAARKGSYLDQLHGFWRAFYLSTYADHFLEDSFAAGHSGFNRPASTPSASERFHRRANENGKLLRDGAGREWRTFGDSNLKLSENAEGKLRVLEATKASIRDLLVAFVLGRRSRSLERDVALRVPVYSNADCSHEAAKSDNTRFVSWNRAVDEEFRRVWLAELHARLPALQLPPAAAPLVVAPALARCGDWNPLFQVQEPASYAITHTFGATQLARVNDFDHVLAATYSFAVYKLKLRFGMDIGWYLSTRAEGNEGVLLAPTLSLPLGGKYGTILAWDLDAKFLALFPATAYAGTAFVQHLGGSLGLGLSVQLGRLNLRASGGPSLLFSNQLAAPRDHWDNPGFGWYSQLGLQFIFAPEGGGRLGPPPI